MDNGLRPRFDMGKPGEDREGDRELTKRIFVVGDGIGTACSSVDWTAAFCKVRRRHDVSDKGKTDNERHSRPRHHDANLGNKL
jgi:hypothetical protein